MNRQYMHLLSFRQEPGVENTIRIADMLDSLVKAKYPEITIISTSSGYDDQGGWASMFSAGGTHTIDYTFSLVPIEERTKSVWIFLTK